MSNPVLDALPQYQVDADAADDNLPQLGTNIGAGTSGDLTGEVRRLKSELRAESLIKSWERLLGLRNLSDTAFIIFTFSNGTTFTVNDNLVAASRNVAVVGRRVKAILAGSTIYGTISAASFLSPTTTVEVIWDTGALDGTLAEIQFGPELRAVADTLIAGNTVDSFPIASTDVLSSLQSLQIDKNELGATGVIHGEFVAYVNSILNGSSVAFYFQYGGTTLTPFPDVHLVNGTGSTQSAFATRFIFRLAARQGVANKQTFTLTAGLTAELPNLVWRAVPNLWTIHRVALPTVDSTVDQPFNVLAQWSLADIANSVTGLAIDLFRGKR